MSSFWWNFHHWLHWKLSKWQLPVQPVMKISSKWRHFRFSVRRRISIRTSQHRYTSALKCWKWALYHKMVCWELKHETICCVPNKKNWIWITMKLVHSLVHSIKRKPSNSLCYNVNCTYKRAKTYRFSVIFSKWKPMKILLMKQCSHICRILAFIRVIWSIHQFHTCERI